MKYKIIHVADLKDFGGIQELVKSLVEFQVTNQKISCGILTPLKAKADLLKYDERIKLYSAHLKSGYDISPIKIYNVYRILLEYDVIHMHGFNLVIAIAAIMSKKPILYTEHGTFQKLNRINSFANIIKKRILGFYFLNYFPKRVVFVSNWLRGNVGLKKANSLVIHNGIKHEKPEPGNSESTDEYNIITVCRLVTRKRVDRLIEAFANVDVEKKINLQIIGDGPLRGSLEKLSGEKISGRNYVFTGYKMDVENYYRKAKLFVLPTEYEPFGLVVLEAAKFGIPVLCFTDGGGALEIINELHPKLIARNINEMTSNLEYWLCNDDERIKVGQSLMKQCKDKFTLQKMATRYFEIYTEVISENRFRNRYRMQ